MINPGTKTGIKIICNLAVIFLLISEFAISAEIKDKEKIMSLLTSKESTHQYQALEKLKGSSIDEEIYQQIGEILLTEKGRFGVTRLACETLGNDKVISSKKKANLLLSALKKQIEYPDLTYEEGAYAPNSEAFKRQYIFALEKLDGQVIPVLKEHLKTARGSFKDYLYIVSGNFKDPTAYGPVSNILKNSKDGWLRASAARSLGLLGDKDAIPLLEEALDDPFLIDEDRTGVDVLGPSGSDMNIIYPVRSEAYHALKLLGVKIKPVGGYKFSIEK